MVSTVTATGVQPFRERFKRRRFEDAPPISQWRCNLTGVSQVQNLYFVAYTADIYVYIPQFPKQTIAEQPVLIFTSQPSAPGLSGYLPRGHPHAINNLVVQFLGNEEVVATVRDDGDVDAFLVRHIVHAIERRSEADSELSVRGEEIRPFFQSNVGKSAWGLAVHAQARILATSANTHEVRVFKFGLLGTKDGETSDDDVEFDSEAQAIEGTDEDRKTDVTYQILNGEANIPYISFCNTGDDPDGRWLLTTDIAGICQVMDLQSMTPVQKFRFGQSFVNRGLLEERFDRLNAGWMVMFLDRRSFQEEEDVCSALGLDEDDNLPWTAREPAIWDISDAIKHLPEYTEPFIYHRPKRRKVGRGPERNGTSPAAAANVVRIAEAGSSDEGDDSDENSSSDGGAPLDVEIEIEGDSVDRREEEETVEPENADSDIASASTSEDDDEEETALIDDAEDPEDEMTEDTIPFTAWYNGQSIKANEPKFALNDAAFWNELPCPIIHASVRNIYLLQPFTNPSLVQATQTPVKPWMPPMVGLANPLRQAIQQDFEYLRVFERLNMVVSIPPLGIVILASQKGRALVLSLTKFRKHQQEAGASEKTSPKAAKQNKNTTRTAKVPTWIDKTHYTMRVECILPFADQEKANERPFAPLHGIAASPVQGCSPTDRAASGRKDGGNNRERWRLMMMYQDHSILSYEVGKQTGATGDDRTVVSVEELIV